MVSWVMLMEMLMLMVVTRRWLIVECLSLSIHCVAFQDIIFVRFHRFNTIIYNPKIRFSLFNIRILYLIAYFLVVTFLPFTNLVEVEELCIPIPNPPPGWPMVPLKVWTLVKPLPPIPPMGSNISWNIFWWWAPKPIKGEPPSSPKGDIPKSWKGDLKGLAKAVVGLWPPWPRWWYGEWMWRERADLWRPPRSPNAENLNN